MVKYSDRRNESRNGCEMGGWNRHEIKNERQREMKDEEICESDVKVNNTGRKQ